MIEARYAGRCGGCGGEVSPGQMIEYRGGKVTRCDRCNGTAHGAPHGAPHGARRPESTWQRAEPQRAPRPKREEKPLPETTPEQAAVALDALLGRLDADQKMVAAWTPADGNLRVVASAGSGKTTTSVALLGRLIRDGLVAPGAVVATTFTRKAGGELLERLAAVVPAPERKTMRIGTFHGIALRALAAAGQTWRMDRCLDGSSRAAGVPTARKLMSCVVGRGDVPGLRDADGLNLGDAADPPAYLQAVDILRSHLLAPGTPEAEAAALRTEAEKRLPFLRRAWALYERAKAGLGAWDYADALAAYHRGLSGGSLSDHAAVVLVDEAQDNSTVQLEIARLLAGADGRVILVGDSRQAIYAWRGAEPAYYCEADRRIGAKTLQLRSNYRSGSAIVEAGNRVAAGKPWALGDASVARRDLVGTVAESGMHATPSGEAAAIAEAVLAHTRDGAALSEIAVLTRTNAQSGPVEAALVRAQIPCAVVGGTPFFARYEVMHVLAYVKLAGEDDWEALGRVANKPKRYLGKAFVEQAKAVAIRECTSMPTAIEKVTPLLRRNQQDGADDLLDTLSTLRGATWPQQAELAAALLSPAADAVENGSDSDRSGVPAAVAAVAASFPDREAFLAFAARCAGEVVQVSAEDEALPAGRVTISTVHKAKGLEWKHLFVLASAGVFPHVRSEGDKARMAEEERLWYVAVTRAKDTLTATWAETNLWGKPAGPSEFIDYILPLGPSVGDVGERGSGGLEGASEAVEAAPEAVEAAPEAAPGAIEAAPEAAPEAVEAAPEAAPEAVEAAPEAAPAPQSPMSPTAAALLSKAVTEAMPGAKAAGEAEPRVQHTGDGSRFVEVKAAAMANLLEPLGFVQMVPTAHREFSQRVWHQALGGGVWLRIYSTIPAHTTSARGLGEDSIRIGLVHVADGRSVSLARKQPWVARTRGWRANLLERIRRVADEHACAPACPDCGSTLRERDGKLGPFWGCVRFPECKGTAPFKGRTAKEA